ncbi:Lipase, class 3 [Gossypium australe]|uniref:Lipase, class 3 n=1 Tax=Gossypium australe TaxID=47621 RepID=A0A5B6UGJ9_9ROSI|nr:Lipase, class 3 [Gossypium australe]
MAGNGDIDGGISGDCFRYLIVRPEKGGVWDWMKYLLWGDLESGLRFLESSDRGSVAMGGGAGGGEEADDRWIIIVSIVVRKLLGEVIIPKGGTETFISTIGQLDERVELYKPGSVTERIVNLELDDRAIMDLYYQKENSTQVFMICDKPKDATLILISFRGTEPFNANDWSTDIDYSWYEIPKVGKLHMGFLEALGLGNREDIRTFRYHLQTEIIKESDGIDKIDIQSLDMTAYHMVREKLRSLLEEHKNAKFIVTGHSLGGALAILFPVVLVIHEEKKLMENLLGVYTFGQPRVGNRQLGKFMEAHLDHPVPKYFRVVYCNDLVPRLPYDDKTFLYKHFGVCLYYNSCYTEQRMEEEPNKNFFDIEQLIPEHANAVWELIRGLAMGCTHGQDYKEGWFSILVRVLGLAMPGVSAHCPTNYINSVRLGKSM